MRDLETQAQFYAMSGRWLHRSSRSAQFYIPHFVGPQELDELLPYLPASDVPESMQNNLQNFQHLVPRDIGQQLIRKMLDFWDQSDAAFQAAASRMDNAHQDVSHERSWAYATLDGIANRILPENMFKDENGNFSKPVLYAVHRSLLREDVAFNSQVRGTLRTGGEYEVIGRQVLKNFQMVRDAVRRYQEGLPEQAGFISVEKFATKARRLIDFSRRTRQFTSHGTLGPSSIISNDDFIISSGQIRETFGGGFEVYLHFLESWAALRSFKLHSPLNAVGSTILRAIDRYDGVDLDQSTAWTCLQEIGIIPPWQNLAAYELRLLDVGPARSHRTTKYSYPWGNIPKDKLEGLRKEWKDLPVYCIDDDGAHEIDDGISIEQTDVSDEYWVHIHTADPAAHISVGSQMANLAEKAVETVYFPERVFPMIPTNIVQPYLSLAPDRPCLTFSAKMNVNGDILEWKITPGKVSDVLYLSPRVLKEIVSEVHSNGSGQTIRRVGPEGPSPVPSRPMMESHQLSDRHKSELHLLNLIAEARAAQLKARGGLSGSPGMSGPSISVSFNEFPLAERGKNTSFHHLQDPTIQVTTDNVDFSEILGRSQGNIVSTFMLVAGEVAARWCHERGIPIPFRVTPRNPDKMDPSEFFVKNVLPSMDENGNTDPEQTAAFFNLLGSVQLSTTAGPHAAIGVDMIARCTSPLRRYGDLLIHWQIEAALSEEKRRCISLVGNTKDSFLPFSKSQVDAMLPRLDTRERLMTHAQRQASKHWLCHFLIRAWQFKEIEIPSPLKFHVRRVDAANGLVYGILTDFLASSICDFPEWSNPESLKEGDRLEVEIVDVNTYERRIKVKALRSLESTE